MTRTMALRRFGLRESASRKCPVCKKDVKIVGEGDGKRYSQHGDTRTGIKCLKSLKNIIWDE